MTKATHTKHLAAVFFICLIAVAVAAPTQQQIQSEMEKLGKTVNEMSVEELRKHIRS